MNFKALMVGLTLMTLGVSRPVAPKPDAGALEARAEVLPPLARSLLHRKMERHGNDMVRLVIAVTLLQREKVKLFASDIANEPRLTRPMAGEEDALNAALPEKLFVLQDELRSRAKTLAEAARNERDETLAIDLGLMMQTCVACHSAFLQPPGEAR